MNKIEVHKGDFFFIPAGTVHGVGAGCLLAEIQESSNVTYRLYDYNRADKNGNKRTLHLNKALQVLDRKTGQRYVQKARLVEYYPGYSREMLCKCRYFETEHICIKTEADIIVTNDSFQVLLFINGHGELKTKDNQEPLVYKKGDCVFIPAGTGECLIIGECELLKVCY